MLVKITNICTYKIYIEGGLDMEIRRVVESDYSVLNVIAKGILEPLYGDQSKALREWFSGEGFKFAFVLASEKETVGFLSLKANPSKPYLKISTLLVFDGHKKLGYGKKLIAKAKKIASELGFKFIKVTVSDAKPESLDFFMGSGFKVVSKEPDKYKTGSTEIILQWEVGE